MAAIVIGKSDDASGDDDPDTQLLQSFDRHHTAAPPVLTAAEAGRRFDWRGFAAHMEASLPSYARPLFVRILPEVPVTATFKHQKAQLRKEGADPAKVKDPIYRYDASQHSYTLLDAAHYQSLTTGRSKL